MSEVAEHRPELRDRRTPSRWARLVVAWRRLQGRTPMGPMVLVILLALLIGVLVGRASVPSSSAQAARTIEATLLPLALDAEGIWTSASDARQPVNEAFVELRREGDPTLVETYHEEWQRAYDTVLVQLAGLDLPDEARPVQRQFIASVALSRDAIEVLAHAATVDDPVLRQDLLTEVARLRQRSEQLAQSARASIIDLHGQRADVSPLGRLTGFLEGRS
jgi:hypothetical protein